MAAKMSNSPAPSEKVKIAAGSIISSKSTDYFVESLLGEGTFGKVVKCTRMDNNKTVAIKLMKGGKSIVSMAKDEELILSELKSLDLDSCNIVQWYEAFRFDGHSCLEFEHLDQSLQNLWTESHKQPLLIREIRPIVQQVANALSHLKSLNIIHSDLKRDNIMLVNHKEEPFKVKLIDFGVAFKEKEASVGSYIQTRVYRAPEILLGLPYTAAIDMWSLGILAATLFLGSYLYPGRNEYDMLRYITDTQGQLPRDLLKLARRTKYFFNWDLKTRQWKLKTPHEFRRKTLIKPKERRTFMMSSLDDLLTIPLHVHMDYGDDAEVSDHLMFVDMLKKMLALDAAERITPHQLLEHPFITMSHMENMCSVSSYVKSCYTLMSVCNMPGTSHGEDDASESLQQEGNKTPPPNESSSLCSPTTSAQPTSVVKSGTKRELYDEDENPQEWLSCSVGSGSSLMCACNLPGCWHGEDDARETLRREVNKTPPPPPPPPKDSSSQFQLINPSPSTNAQPTRAVKSAIKRKLNHEDENPHENSHYVKKRKLEQHRLDDRHWPSSKIQRPESCRTKGFERRGEKRKMAGKQEWIQPTNSDHNQRFPNDTKRKRVDFEGPSTFDGSSGTQTNNSQRVHQKVTRVDDSHTHHYGRSDSKRKCYAGVANDRGHYSTNYNSHPAEHYRRGNHHASSAQTDFCARSGRKRKATDYGEDEVWPSKRPSVPCARNEESIRVVSSAEGRKIILTKRSQR